MNEEWAQMTQAVLNYGQSVDLIKERQAFETWCASLGYPTQHEHHDPSLGYNGLASVRHFDRWLGWLARAAASPSDESESL